MTKATHAGASTPSPEEIVHDTDHNRYQLWVDGQVAALADYSLANGLATFTHTETNPEFQNRGLASRLVAFALDDARRRGWKVRPVCSFVGSYAAQHPAVADLIDTDH